MHLIATCVRDKLRIVSAMGAAARLDPTLVRVADLSETRDRSVRARPAQKPAPQARPRLHAAHRRVGGVLRGAADRRRRRSRTTTARSAACARAATTASTTASTSNRVEGSIAFVPSVFGMTMASVAVKLLLGLPLPKSRRARAAASRVRATGTAECDVLVPGRAPDRVRPSRPPAPAPAWRAGRVPRRATRRVRSHGVRSHARGDRLDPGDQAEWERIVVRPVSRAVRRVRGARSMPRSRRADRAAAAPAGRDTAPLRRRSAAHARRRARLRWALPGAVSPASSPDGDRHGVRVGRRRLARARRPRRHHARARARARSALRRPRRARRPARPLQPRSAGSSPTPRSRNDAGFAHACQLAANACGNSAP